MNHKEMVELKRIMYMILCFCMAFFEIISDIPRVNAEFDITNKKGGIFVNNIEIDDNNELLTDDDEIIVPFRAVLETLGSTVIWEQSTGNVYFDYAGIVYVCRFKVIDREDFPPLLLFGNE